MIDLAKFAALITNILGGVAILSVIVFAAVAYLKQWGVAGRNLTASGFGVGLVIAFAGRFMVLPPISLTDWIATAFMGLMSGFLATGAYKGGEDATGKNTIPADTALLLTEFIDPPEGEYMSDLTDDCQ